MSLRALLVMLVLLAPRATPAEPRFVLRFATTAPDGSAWAREMRAAALDVARTTNGEVAFKWYFGGIAGDELEVRDRIERGQLDGVGAGSALCDQVMPSMRVLALTGLLQSHREAAHVMQSLEPVLAREATERKYALLGVAGLGPYVIFSRKPVRTMAELRSTKLWIFSLLGDDIEAARAMGLQVVGGTVQEASQWYDAGRVDGFLTFPALALAFQWSAQARFLTDLRMRFRSGCVLVATRALDRLPVEHQRAIRVSTTKGTGRFDELGRLHDESLIGGVFEKQGLKSVPVTATFRAEFFEAARHAREHLIQKNVVSPEVLSEVVRLLADFRAEHAP